MKPALALVLVVGVNVLSAPSGVAGLIAGAGVLLVALFGPFTVYRLLAFVDPGTNAGAAARANFSRLSQRGSSDGGQGEAAGSDGGWRRRGRGGARGPVRRRRHRRRGRRVGRCRAAAGGAAGGGAGVAAGRWRPVAAVRPRAAGGAAVAGVALVAAAGQFAGRYAGQTMDAAAVGHPHGGRGGAPPAARGGGATGGPGSPADRGHADDPGDVGDPGDPGDRADYGDSPATWGAPPDHDPGYDPDTRRGRSAATARPRLRRGPRLRAAGLRLRPRLRVGRRAMRGVPGPDAGGS